jgi:hypothetical protein
MRFLVPVLMLVVAHFQAVAATLERLTLDDMTVRATAIVRARVAASSPVLVGSTIYTKTHFQVLERWKGPQSAELDVVEPGGTVGSRSQVYPGVPQFSHGEELVLFLWTGPSGRTQVIGLWQGVLHVSHDAATGELVVSRQPGEEVVLAPGTGQPVRAEAISMPLRALAAQMQRVIRNQPNH